MYKRIYSALTRWLNHPCLVFLFYWVVVFILYLPATKAGRVGDFPGWVHFLKSVSFIDYVNRKGTGIPSMYQFTQVVTWLFYQVFKANAWLWHLLYVSLQALNATLLFIFFSRLFNKSAINDGALVAFSGAFIFCVSPHISEVVVWEPSFHYLLGLLLILVVLICAQNYLETLKLKYALWGGLVFFLSTYSLEVFYLTPFFVFSLGYYFQILEGPGKKVLGKIWLYFTLPQILIFILNLALLHSLYHQSVAHIGEISLAQNAVNFSKPLKYVFHILFLGRYFPAGLKGKVYDFAESCRGIFLFYGLFSGLLLFIVLFIKKAGYRWKVSVLLFLWVVLCTGLIIPLWFPNTGYVIYDRYTYVLSAFAFVFLALLLRNICNRYVFLALILAYALINARFTHKVNAYWQQSARVVNNLVYDFPNNPSKKVLLLNLPECLDGVQMVGTRDDGEFRMMYNAIMPVQISNPVYDVEAFYMQSPSDGAHVKVINDSTLTVTLNQWGTWWLYYGLGSTSYENVDFKVNMKDEGHFYELTLKQPWDEYLLLYMVEGRWKTVDMSRKGEDQF